MNYRISESKLHSVVSKYLNSLGLIDVYTPNKIYFVYSMEDEYATLRIDKEDFFCEVNYKLIDKLSSFFSMSTTECWDAIVKWLDEQKDIKILDIWSADGYLRADLRL